MTPLTTRQRDLLRYLLTADQPIIVADIASHLNLTSRQVTYGLKYVRAWLAQRDIELQTQSGVGITLDYTVDQRQHLMYELNHLTSVQLILTAGQRQQLIAFKLLTTDEPIILYQLQQELQVSRTTLLKDLDVVEAWVRSLDLVLQRRPNYGFLLEGTELAIRQTITALLWGATEFGPPIIEVSYLTGLEFSLADSASLLTIVDQIYKISHKWVIERPQSWIEFAERRLEAKFTDEASLHLALLLAVQTQRARDQHMITFSDEVVRVLKCSPTWQVAERICQHMWLESVPEMLEYETAFTTMHLISGSRSDVLNEDMPHIAQFTELIDRLIEQIGEGFQQQILQEDEALRQGLTTHLIPLFFRQKYGLWSPPPRQTAVLSNEYTREHNVAHDLAITIANNLNIILPSEEINNLVLLLRAAYLRQQPLWQTKVVVVCPSGIATSQLLVARLKARFPRLGKIETLSVRELTRKKISSDQIIISTVPLPTLQDDIEIIYVHPLLKPADIEKIRQKFT